MRKEEIVEVVLGYRRGTELATLNTEMRGNFGRSGGLHRIIGEFTAVLMSEAPKPRAFDPDDLEIWTSSTGPTHFGFHLENRDGNIPESFLRGETRMIRIFPDGKWEEMVPKTGKKAEKEVVRIPDADKTKRRVIVRKTKAEGVLAE